MSRRPLLQRVRICLWAIDPTQGAGRSPSDPFVQVDPSQVDSLAAVMGMPARIVVDRLRGSRCYAGRLDGRIVTYGWVSEGATRIGEIEAVIQPGPGEAYIWDCAALPAYRGRGLYRGLLRAMLADLAARTVQRVWIATLDDGGPGARGAAGASFHPVLRLRYLRVGRRVRRRVRIEKGAAIEEIEAAGRTLRGYSPSGLPSIASSGSRVISSSAPSGSRK